MLKELENYFSQKGMYSGTHDFFTIKLSGGFEAFSGRASETWEYIWTVEVFQNYDLRYPISHIKIIGKPYQKLDDICNIVLQQLRHNDSIEGMKIPLIPDIRYKERSRYFGSVDAVDTNTPEDIVVKNLTPEELGFVDWNQFGLDELAEYLDEKYMYSSSGEALAIHKLIEFYRNNKK